MKKRISYPGWNEYVANLYARYQDIIQQWRVAGHPDDMLEMIARRKDKFMVALQYVKQLKADMEARHLMLYKQGNRIFGHLS